MHAFRRGEQEKTVVRKPRKRIDNAEIITNEEYLIALEQKEAEAKLVEEQKLAKKARRSEKQKENAKPSQGKKRGRPKKAQTA